jgi:hypothetical protein
MMGRNKFLRYNITKEALHVPQNETFGRDEKVFEYLLDDIMKSERPNIEKILSRNEVDLLIYQGK